MGDQPPMVTDNFATRIQIAGDGKFQQWAKFSSAPKSLDYDLTMPLNLRYMPNSWWRKRVSSGCPAGETMLIEQPCGTTTVLPLVGTDIACPIPNQGRPSTCSIVFKGLSDYNAKSNTWGKSTQFCQKNIQPMKKLSQARKAHEALTNYQYTQKWIFDQCKMFMCLNKPSPKILMNIQTFQKRLGNSEERMDRHIVQERAAPLTNYTHTASWCCPVPAPPKTAPSTQNKNRSFVQIGFSFLSLSFLLTKNEII